MVGVGYLLLGVVLSAIAWEDIRHRTVHTYWFLGLMAVLFGLQLGTQTIETVMTKYLYNLLFLAVLLGLLHIYYAVRHRRFVWLFDRALGWGDVVLLVCLSGVWTLPGFVVFMIASLIFSLVIHMLCTRRYQDTVPLAGLQAISFGIFYILEKNNVISIENLINY